MKLKLYLRFSLLITCFIFMPFMMGASDLSGTGCLGSLSSSYSIGGSISGLSGTVVLQNNSGDDLSITADGSFTFSTPLLNGDSYEVTVLTQPSNQSCSVINASGTISESNITNIAVTCSNSTYTVGGSISGLSGTVVLQNNSGDDLSITADGSFTFSTPVANEATYEVAILTQPTDQICSVSNASGTISGTNITNVTITCVNTFIIGGTVSGLVGTVILQNNSGDNLSITADGSFTFDTPLLDGTTYDATVLTQPDGQTCVITNGSGTANATVSDINVSCTTNPN